MRGADALIRALVSRDVTAIFALSGNQIMPVFDAIFDTDIQLIHTRHEAATVQMAEAYAQVTNGVGVALVTAGGGLGNAAGALIAARASDTPVVLLSGDSPVAKDGAGAFQEMDQIALTQSMTKASWRIMTADDIGPSVLRALDLAQRGRPGPVHLALPADVLLEQVATPVAQPPTPDSETSEALDLQRMAEARAPLVILGPSLTETRAPGLAAHLQTALAAPVVAMESPRGLNDPALGRLRELAREVDHVLCIGKQIDFTLGFGAAEHWPQAQTWDVVAGDQVSLDLARKNLGPRLHSSLEAHGKEAAKALLATSPDQPERTAWIKRARAMLSARVASPVSQRITPADICGAVQTDLDAADETVLICDGGEFGQWAQAFSTAPRRVMNGVSGMIGGGLGYAMGAKTAAPDALVVALMGDGTVGFHLGEFETAVRAQLPFVAVIGNDRRWNAEHLIQTRSFGAERRIGCDLSGARYDLAVEALGGFGAHVTRKDQLGPALRSALESGLPACINVEMEGFAAPSF
ncbi:thiamine pyrophosphate-binding protein [Primorskyibacter sp. S187A]|uniref:thiamine pyrophosphate-binding protein n=1 Tax=Primorskyibacter sp. S187A TaxID=3415130 RepID=UPI003C7AC266